MNRNQAVSFASNAGGQVLLRTKTSNNATNPEDRHYYLDGLEVGFLSSDGKDQSRIGYAEAMAGRMRTQGHGPYRFGGTTGATEGQFGLGGYRPINPGSAAQGNGSGYIVRAGDTLQSIAASTWGDAGLWCKIAEANGLNGSELLVGGQALRLPQGVVGIHHSAETFRPYDPNKELGELSPIVPRPQAPPRRAGGGNNCGVFGALLLTVVAVAVTAWVAPWATAAVAKAGLGLSGVAAVAVDGAIAVAGLIASQGRGSRAARIIGGRAERRNGPFAQRDGRSRSPQLRGATAHERFLFNAFDGVGPTENTKTDEDSPERAQDELQ